MALSQAPRATVHLPPAFAALDDDLLDDLYSDLEVGRLIIFDYDPLAAAALYDAPMRLVYAELVRRTIPTIGETIGEWQEAPETESELRSMWGDR